MDESQTRRKSNINTLSNQTPFSNNRQSEKEYKVVKDFDSRVAADVGTDAAIILNNIRYWSDQNRANNRNFHDGFYWTYNTYEAFQKQFYWLSLDRIKRIIKKLKQKGYLLTGNFNKHKYDRTLWYTPRYMVRNRTLDCAIATNALSVITPPIPYNNTNNDQIKTIGIAGGSGFALTSLCACTPTSSEGNSEPLSKSETMPNLEGEPSEGNTGKNEAELEDFPFHGALVNDQSAAFNKRLLKVAHEAFDEFAPNWEKGHQQGGVVEKAAKVAQLFFQLYETKYEKTHDNRTNNSLREAFGRMYEFVGDSDMCGSSDLEGGLYPFETYAKMINLYFDWMDKEGKTPRFEHFCHYEIMKNRWYEACDHKTNWWEGNEPKQKTIKPETHKMTPSDPRDEFPWDEIDDYSNCPV